MAHSGGESPGGHFDDAAERFQTMSIARNPLGCTITSSRKRELHPEPKEEVFGAQPKPYLTHARETFHHVADIEGAAPKPLIGARTGHYEPLSLDDIRGSRPKQTYLKTNRVVDPLQPVYKLPIGEALPPSPPPYKRDLYQVDDIAGTKPAPLEKWQPRESLMVDDISGTRPKLKIREASGHFDMLDVHDINSQGMFRTQRNTDPLKPVYAINSMVVYDDAPQKTKAARKAPRQDGTLFSLTTADVEGAKPASWSTLKVAGTLPRIRTEFRDPNAVGDIEGAAAGSRRKGISGSARESDPNERMYPLLDGRPYLPEELKVGHNWYAAASKLVSDDVIKAATEGMADKLETEAELRNSSFGLVDSGTVPPAMATAKRLLDPRDAEIAKLHGEVQALQLSGRHAAVKGSLHARGRKLAAGDGSQAAVDAALEEASWPLGSMHLKGVLRETEEQEKSLKERGARLSIGRKAKIAAANAALGVHAGGGAAGGGEYDAGGTSTLLPGGMAAYHARARSLGASGGASSMRRVIPKADRLGRTESGGAAAAMPFTTNVMADSAANAALSSQWAGGRQLSAEEQDAAFDAEVAKSARRQSRGHSVSSGYRGGGGGGAGGGAVGGEDWQRPSYDDLGATGSADGGPFLQATAGGGGGDGGGMLLSAASSRRVSGAGAASAGAGSAASGAGAGAGTVRFDRRTDQPPEVAKATMRLTRVTEGLLTRGPPGPSKVGVAARPDMTRIHQIARDRADEVSAVRSLPG